MERETDKISKIASQVLNTILAQEETAVIHKKHECSELSRIGQLERDLIDLRNRQSKSEAELNDGRVSFEGIRKDIHTLTGAIQRLESVATKAALGIIGTVGMAVIYQALTNACNRYTVSDTKKKDTICNTFLIIGKTFLRLSAACTRLLPL
jgi:hypothetical protein